jgi:hypothetical protein
MNMKNQYLFYFVRAFETLRLIFSTTDLASLFYKILNVKIE